MGLFDIFSAEPAQNAAKAQTAGLNSAYQQYSGLANTGREAITSNYGQAASPYQSLFSQYQPGVNAYGNATGVNGQAGYDQAMQNFHASPGFDFALNKGVDAINRSGVARGAATGNILRGAQDYGTGLANQEWGNYINRLQPYFGASNAAASGLGSIYGNEANALGNSFTGQGTQAYNTQSGIGQSNAAGELAPYNASGNLWNTLLQGGKLAAGVYGSYAGQRPTPTPTPARA